MQTENPNPTPTPTEVHPLFQLLDELKKGIAGATILSDVLGLLKQVKKDEAVKANAQKLALALDNFVAIDRALKAIKPAPLGFDEKAQPVNLVFSADQTKQRKQLEESKAKALKILNTALETGDFSQLNNIKAPSGGKPAEANADEQPAA